MTPVTTQSKSGAWPPWAFLAVSVAVTAILPHIPYVRVLGWPLMMFSTLVHELGHGLTAVILGGHFDHLEMHWSGSGVAHCGVTGRISSALVSAGGLVGPAIVGAFFLMAARTPRWAKRLLLGSGVFLLFCDLFYCRDLLGFVFASVSGVAFILLALKAAEFVSQMTLAFMGVQLASLVYSRSDYLFTEVAHTANGQSPSDVANMARELFLPYWFWGAVCGAFSAAVLVVGVWVFLRGINAPKDVVGGIKAVAAKVKG